VEERARSARRPADARDGERVRAAAALVRPCGGNGLGREALCAVPRDEAWYQRTEGNGGWHAHAGRRPDEET
jgi:hypothetical protein